MSQETTQSASIEALTAARIQASDRYRAALSKVWDSTNEPMDRRVAAEIALENARHDLGAAATALNAARAQQVAA